jgi:hypothetical protein
MKKFLAEPLLHFLLIGALLFVLFEVLRSPGDVSDKRIVITQSDVEALQANFARTWQRPPTMQELPRLVEEKVRGEIAYREAVAMGLDVNDAYIKQRLKTKLEFMLEDISTLDQPTDQELADYLAQHREKFRREAQVSFVQVYLGEQPSEQEAARVLAQLTEAGADAELETYGKSIMLPLAVSASPLSAVDRRFGSGFTAQLESLPVGQWQGPVVSSYGYHLVQVNGRVAAMDPPLEAVRPEVMRELIAERIKTVKETTYAGLREQYEVVIETDEGQGQ